MSWFHGGDGQKDGQKSIPRQVQDWIDTQPVENEAHRKPAWYVSSIAYLCPRAMAIRAIVEGRVPKERGFEAKQIVRFDVGTSVHWWWQNCYLGPMQKLVGRWVCVKCGAMVEGKMPLIPHAECDVKYGRGPGHVFWEYIEPTVRHKEPGWKMSIVGHTDGLIEESTPPEGETETTGLLEMKTVNAQGMPVKEISADYKFQAQVYMWLAGRAWTKFVFINPDGVFRNTTEPGLKIPCQEMLLKYDDSYRVQALQRVGEAEAAYQELLRVKEGKAAFTSWPDKRCATKSEKMAERCGVAGICMNEVVVKRMALRLSEGKDPVEGILL